MAGISQSSDQKEVVNAMSIDVEDYFQVSAFEKHIDRASWPSLECRVAANIDRILSLLSDQEIKATFFTLGWIAERYPDVVKKIVSEGHELASHGYFHQRVSDLSPGEFKQDILDTKHLLEDLSGKQIVGYRAPSYSIGEQNLWAHEVLEEAGYRYSSSVYPIQHDHYGMPSASRYLFKPSNTQGLIEIPITTATVAGKRIPAGGGGYFRLFPYALSKWMLQQNSRDNQSSVFYFHPWEIDPGQPVQKGVGWKTRFRHYVNLKSMEGKLERLFSDFNWGRVDQVFLPALTADQ